MTPRIRFDQVRKAFGGTIALDGVSFSVSPGCVHALVGENGAGKTTLMRILAGDIRPDSGAVFIDGQPFAPADARAARDAGVAIVHQELSLAAHLSVAENVFLGRWPRCAPGVVDFAALRRRANELLTRLAINLPLDARAGSLSVAQQQMVEIARALSIDARVLVLDEPSAVLTPREVEALFTIVRALTARSVSVIYISHRLEEIFTLADHVTVMRDGRHVSTRSVRETSRESLIRDTVGRELSPPLGRRAERRAEVVLDVRALASRARFEDVSLQVFAGEVFGLTGLVGSGRSSLALAIFGAAPVHSGAINVAGRPGPFRSPRQALRAGVALAPEDRKRDGLLLARSLRENLTLPHLRKVSAAGLLRPAAERELARRLIDQRQIKSSGTEAVMNTLSGGNQQKALIARWLTQPYPLLILDEPTRGVDVGAKSEIHSLIHAVAARGAAILIVTSELPEAISLCDRIGVMCRGRLAGVLDNAERDVAEEHIMGLAIGAAEP